MNKAQRFNRNMGLGMLALGIVVLALVFGLLYVAFQNQAHQQDTRNQAVEGDRITLLIDINEHLPRLRPTPQLHEGGAPCQSH